VKAIARSAGPTNRPRKPKERKPPKTPRITSVIGISTPRLISQGRIRLSLRVTNSRPQASKKMPQPWSP